jgi:hypothetical protein
MGKRRNSGWTDFATAFYRNKKKTNPSYTYSDALKEAGPHYHKSNKSQTQTQTQKQPTSNRKSKSRRRRTARRGRR